MRSSRRALRGHHGSIRRGLFADANAARRKAREQRKQEQLKKQGDTDVKTKEA